MSKLKGKIAIITGGSRGIGKAIARAFLAEGANIAIAARKKDEVEKSVDELSELGSVVGYQADISKEREVEYLVSEVLRDFSDIDILVNNAGIQGPIGRFWEVSFEEWSVNFKVNLLGTARLTRQVLPLMLAKKAGKIINLSGGGAISPRPYFSAYGVGKTAVVRLTEVLAEEVKDYHIDVNAIAPGAVNTNMLEEVLGAGVMAGEKEIREAMERKENGGVSPDRAAELAVFLASGESDGITGRLISAVWDNWQQFNPVKIKEIIAADLYTLRRVC